MEIRRSIKNNRLESHIYQKMQNELPRFLNKSKISNKINTKVLLSNLNMLAVNQINAFNIDLHVNAPFDDQLFVCCIIVYSYQLLVGSSYTVTSYHGTVLPDSIHFGVTHINQ